jgi:hypothetical protein
VAKSADFKEGRNADVGYMTIEIEMVDKKKRELDMVC